MSNGEDEYITSENNRIEWNARFRDSGSYKEQNRSKFANDRKIGSQNIFQRNRVRKNSTKGLRCTF